MCDPQRELGRVVFIYKGNSSATAESKLLVIGGSGGLTSSLARQYLTITSPPPSPFQYHTYLPTFPSKISRKFPLPGSLIATITDWTRNCKLQTANCKLQKNVRTTPCSRRSHNRQCSARLCHMVRYIWRAESTSPSR